MTNQLEFRVGLLTILALFLFVWLVGKVEDWQPFKHVYRLGVTFYDVQRLVVGDPVRLNGLPVGKVKLMLVKGGLVLVWLEVDDTYKVLRKSVFTIGTAGFFGANYIKIKQPLAEDGTPNQYLGPDEVVSGTEEPGLDRLIEEGQQIFGSARVTFDALNKILGDADFRDNIKDTAKNLRVASADADEAIRRLRVKIDEVENDLKGLTSEAKDTIHENRDQVKKLVENLRKLSEDLKGVAEDNRAKLKQAVDSLSRFAQKLDDKGETAKKLKDAVANLDRLTNDYSASGPIGRKLDVTAKNATAITSDLKEVTGKLRDFATDPKTENKIGQTMDDIHSLRQTSDQFSTITTNITFDLAPTQLYDLDRKRFRGDFVMELGYGKFYGFVGQEDIGRAEGINVVQGGTRFFDDFIVRTGAFRDGLTNHPGLGVDAELFDKNLVLTVEGLHFNDPLLRVIGRYKINDKLDAEVRRENINRGNTSTLVGVQTHF